SGRGSVPARRAAVRAVDVVDGAAVQDDLGRERAGGGGAVVGEGDVVGRLGATGDGAGRAGGSDQHRGVLDGERAERSGWCRVRSGVGGAFLAREEVAPWAVGV